MKLIYKNENRAVVYSVRNVLEMYDIETMIKNEYGHPSGGEFGLSNSLLELWLANDQDYERAKAIIDAQLEAPVDPDPWTCGNCGEENDGNFHVCWNCQAARPVPSGA